jgi:hypothetical protein
MTLGIYGHALGDAQRDAVKDHAERIENTQCRELIGADFTLTLLASTKLVGASISGPSLWEVRNHGLQKSGRR